MEKSNFNLNNYTKEIYMPDEQIRDILNNNYYQQSIQKADNSDVDINHLENIFSDEFYYLAMKMVPLRERKVLYLAYIDNATLNEICKTLKLQKKQVISLRNKAIIHFNNNLQNLYKLEKIRGGKNDKR